MEIDIQGLDAKQYPISNTLVDEWIALAARRFPYSDLGGPRGDKNRPELGKKAFDSARNAVFLKGFAHT